MALNLQQPDVLLLGRFPPPLDGQTIATEHLSNFLGTYCQLAKIDLGYSTENLLPRISTFKRVCLFSNKLSQVKKAVQESSGALIIYASMSGSVAGHLRDAYLFTSPALRNHPVWVVLHHGNYEGIFHHLPFRLLARWIANQVQIYICLSPALARTLAVHLPKSKITVIPNTVDNDILCTDHEIKERHRRASSEEELRIIFLSNMHVSKGFCDLLSAVSILNNKGLKLSADFIGAWPDTPTEALFYKKVDELKLTQKANYRGIASKRIEVKEFFMKADVMVLPTYYPYEAQPLSIIEAFSAGVPVIATRYAGIPDMVVEGFNGMLVEPRNVIQLADRIERIRSPEIWNKLSLGALESFSKMYHPKVVQHQWLDLLRSYYPNLPQGDFG